MNGSEKQSRPDLDTLRSQLSELNVRSRWYVAQLWQIPLAFVAATAIPVAQLVKVDHQPAMVLGLLGAAFAGLLIFLHLLGVLADAERTVTNLQEIEKALGLERRAEWTKRDYLPLLTLIGGFALGYFLAALWLLCPLKSFGSV